MELEELKSGLVFSKDFMDRLLSADIISLTDYRKFYEIAMRLDRKVVKRDAKETLNQKVIEKKNRRKIGD